MINQKITKIEKKKQSQASCCRCQDMLSSTEETSGGMNEISYQLSIEMTVLGR
jgi:hypothetical protein